jgi:cytochrome b
VPSDGVRVQVWDLPTRLVHWLVAVLIGFSWWSATHDRLPWHRLSGHTILGLLGFRLIWGFAGPRTARFAAFLAGPARLRAYLSGGLRPTLGHNPLGGWSVAAMLAVLGLQVGLGLFSIDEDSLEPGPLAGLVSFDAARTIASLHHKLFWVLVGLIALHLLALGFYALRGHNLTAAMISGQAPMPDGESAPEPIPAWRSAAAAAAAAAFAWWIAHGFRL